MDLTRIYAVKASGFTTMGYGADYEVEYVANFPKEYSLNRIGGGDLIHGFNF